MKEIEFQLALNQKLIAIADLILFYHNPCEAVGGRCLAGDPNPCCIRTRFKRWGNPNDKRCEFFGSDGCTWENIECKVWLCDAAKLNASTECLQALDALDRLSKIYRLTNESS